MIEEGDETYSESRNKHCAASSKSSCQRIAFSGTGARRVNWSGDEESDWIIDTNSVTIGDSVGGAESDGGLSVLGARNSSSDGQAGGGGGTGRGCHVRL